MTNLPEAINEDEVKTMFGHADKDGNGFINYREFTMMCKVPKQEVIPMKMAKQTSFGDDIDSWYDECLLQKLQR